MHLILPDYELTFFLATREPKHVEFASTNNISEQLPQNEQNVKLYLDQEFNRHLKMYFKVLAHH